MADAAELGRTNLTERQQRWFASVQANLQDRTGKSLAEWVAIARACPHERPGARATWLRETHGLGVNHAAYVLGEAFPNAARWGDPDGLRNALWSDPGSRNIFEALDALAHGVDGVLTIQRKGYSSWSRKVQFAAARPLKDGKALLGLKLDPQASDRLAPSVRKESWSERLTATVVLSSPAEVDEPLAVLFERAAQRG
jgi:hypothetical protein